MARLNDTKAIASCPDHGTDRMSLPDSGRAETADQGLGVVMMPRKPQAASGPDARGRSLSGAVGYLRGGLRGAD